MTCGDFPEVSNELSLRYLGPLDAARRSLSIYSGTNDSMSGGTERTFTSVAANNFGFTPTYLVITGGSSWTGFSSEDFSGLSTCFGRAQPIAAFPLAGQVIRSVAQGCGSDLKYDSVKYYADNSACGDWQKIMCMHAFSIFMKNYVSE